MSLAGKSPWRIVEHEGERFMVRENDGRSVGRSPRCRTRVLLVRWQCACLDEGADAAGAGSAVVRARCPTNCGNELGGGHFIVCATCWPLVSPAIRNEVATYETAIKTTRNPFLRQKYMKLARSAKERAVQFVIDRRNEKVTA